MKQSEWGWKSYVNPFALPKTELNLKIINETWGERIIKILFNISVTYSSKRKNIGFGSIFKHKTMLPADQGEYFGKD